MRRNSVLQKHPILRLLLPLMLGIVLADAFYQPLASLQGYLLGITLFSFVLLVACLWRCKNWFVLFLHLTLMGVGMLLTSRWLEKASFTFPEEYGAYQIRIEEQPEEKPRSILCRSSLLTSDSTLMETEKTFLFYLAKDSASYQLTKGDTLWVYAQLEPVEPSGIPEAFDYGRYLRRKGVCGSAYVASGHWKMVGHSSSMSVMDRLEKVREGLKERYRELGFQGDELALLTALTVGEKEDLSEEIREVYSVSGASHVLAISGLHIGLLYSILWMLFTPWRRNRKFKTVSVFIIIGVLWTFAALTGFPVSVVRSVIMFSLIGISSLLQEKPHTLNTLATAAFLMLLFRPLWLFEIGFQMSFAAVASIVLLHPKLSSLWNVRHWSLRWFRDMLSVSIAAQIGVAPIIAFYFHRFSVYFLLTNFWVIPMVSVVMYVAVFMLVLLPFPTLQQWVAILEIKLIHWQNAVLEGISQWPSATIDRIWLTVIEVFAWYVVIWLCYRFFQKHTPQRTLQALAGLLLLVGGHWWLGQQAIMKPGIVFYNVRGCPAVHLVSGLEESYIIASDSLQQVDQLIRQADPYWMRRNLAVPLVRTIENQIVSFHGKRICLVNDDRWRKKASAQRLPIDYLYVSSGYRGTLEELCTLFNVHEVIVDSSLSDYYRERLERECREKHIPLRRMSSEGILEILI